MCYGLEPFEVLQLIGADGWKSVYECQGVFKEVPLAAFALVRNNNDGFVFMAGMSPVADDARVILPSENSSDIFLGYIGPGESVNKFNERRERK